MLFMEAVSFIKSSIYRGLNLSINKINKKGNKLANTWNSKSGNNFNSKTKSISNMEVIRSNGIGVSKQS